MEHAATNEKSLLSLAEDLPHAAKASRLELDELQKEVGHGVAWYGVGWCDVVRPHEQPNGSRVALPSLGRAEESCYCVCVFVCGCAFYFAFAALTNLSHDQTSADVGRNKTAALYRQDP